VQIADLGIDAEDDFAVDLQHQAQHAMRDGCCGPMLMTMCWSLAPSAGSRTGMPARVAHLAIALHRVVLAQWMALELIGHHDAAQVGVLLEANAEQVEDLALEIVGPGHTA